LKGLQSLICEARIFCQDYLIIHGRKEYAKSVICVQHRKIVLACGSQPILGHNAISGETCLFVSGPAMRMPRIASVSARFECQRKSAMDSFPVA